MRHMRGDCLATVEDAYRLDADEREWLQRIVDSAGRWLPGMAVSGWTFRIEEGPSLQLSSVVAQTGADEELVESQGRAVRANPRIAALLVSRAAPCGTASETLGPLPESVQRHNPQGVADGFGVIGLSPEGHGVQLSAALARARSPSRRERAVCSRVAAHLATAYRLRIALRGRDAELPDSREAEAVLAPDGRCMHAEGAATSSSARERLRAMARDVDRARTRERRRDADEALALWRGLVSGRWSLVDHFDTDGRRYVVAMCNPPQGRPLRALSEREGQVAALAAHGYSHKLTAYALGLAPSTVAGHLQRAIRKLGLRNRTELVARLSPLAGRPDGS